MKTLVAYLRNTMRVFDNRVAARPNANIVATDVTGSSIHPELLGVYFTTVWFAQGDAWEVIR